MLMSNSAAILTDAFPAGKRGMALGVNQIAGISGQFVGLLLGGLLAAVDWRLVFWVNVPIGIAGTIWSYRSLREIATTRRARIDWWGNVTFGLGATALLVAITYGIQPYGGHATGWANPKVLGGLAIGTALLVATAGFIGLMLLPVNFPYWVFALLIFTNGIGSGLFASPNTSAIMSSVPARHRGSASGMRSTFQNSGMSLSIGIFFSLMIAGLAATLPRTLSAGLHAQGVPLSVATQVSHLPPVSTVFAALLGYNPVQHLLQPSGVLATLPHHNVAVLTGRQFFPHLISAPFHHGLVIVFSAAAAMSLIGALVSLLRGRQFYYDEAAGADGPSRVPATPVPTTTPPNGKGPGHSPMLPARPSSGAREQPPADAER
jgi:MFS family permease